MGNLLAALYLAAFACCGLLCANALFRKTDPLARLWLGLALGLAMLLWFPALFTFLFGFTLAAQLCALGLALALGAAAAFFARRGQDYRVKGTALSPFLATVLPLFLLSAVLLSTHTIVSRDGALWVGQSTYGDLAMHLGFITSIAEQGTFPPMYSICPDTALCYPFLCDSVSSTFYVLGASLRVSAMLPALYALLTVFCGVYLFFARWLKREGAAVLATYLFFVGGGFGFAYFFDLAQFQPDRLSSLFSAFYETPTNFPTDGLRWVNPIADMLIPQRATLFGWALLFPCLYLLYRAAFEKDWACFLPLGVLAGALPLVHTHSFLALGIISAAYLARSVFRREGARQLCGYACYAALALLLAAPQLILFTFRQAGGFLTLHWNWANESDSFLWFYIKNWGLLFLLMPAAFLCARCEDRAVFGGAAAVWALAEMIQFQPNTYDNNKLIFVFFAFLCGLVANFLAKSYERLLAVSGRETVRLSVRLAAAAVCLCLFLSGGLTLGREYVSQYQLVGAAEVEMAEYVKANTEKDATFLTCNNHNNAVAMLTGRNIVCGSGTFLFFHGIDYSAREYALHLMYEEPSVYFDAQSAQYDVDYVLIGPYERGSFSVDEDYFSARFACVYDEDGLRIYDVGKAA